MSSITAGLVSANSAVSSSGLSASPSRARSTARGATSSASERATVRPDPRRGMNDQYEALITSMTGRETHSGSMYSGYTHSRSDRASPSTRRRLRTSLGEGKGCSGEMWSPLALSPPRSVAPARTSSIHQSDRFGGTWIPTPGNNRRASPISRFMSSSVTSHAHAGASSRGPAHTPVRQYSRVAASAISAGSRP